MIAGSVTAGKSRTITEGPQMPTATSQKWNTAWLQSQSVGVAQRTRRNFGREVPTRKAVPTNGKDQSDVADEMLVERPRRRHSRHREVPIVWRVEHEEAVRLGPKAEHDGYAETKPFQHHRSRLLRGRTCGEP